MYIAGNQVCRIIMLPLTRLVGGRQVRARLATKLIECPQTGAMDKLGDCFAADATHWLICVA